jgi:hypothetical protein
LLVREGVSVHAAALLQEPFPPCRASLATYSEAERIRDKIEAEANVMFHRSSVGQDQRACT